MATHWPHLFNPHLMILLLFSTLFLYTPYIINCMYTYVNIELVLKATRANKELHLSSLVISPRKEHKQDRVDHFLLPSTTFLHIHGLAT